jgi:hypothetical protein
VKEAIDGAVQRMDCREGEESMGSRGGSGGHLQE